MTIETLRRSPVSFDRQSVQTERRGDWTVVLEYENEDGGPYVIDLSHRTRWDLQSDEIAQKQAWGIPIPETPGSCVLKNGILINRMNRTQASLWHLQGEIPADPEDPDVTDVTEATLFLALLGKNIFDMAEKLTSLDFLDPRKETPCLFQGPFSHVPCQIVMLARPPQISGLLLTCSRGYARDMLAAIFAAGTVFEIRPGGEKAYSSWLNELMQPAADSADR